MKLSKEQTYLVTEAETPCFTFVFAAIMVLFITHIIGKKQ